MGLLQSARSFMRRFVSLPISEREAAAYIAGMRLDFSSGDKHTFLERNEDEINRLIAFLNGEARRQFGATACDLTRHDYWLVFNCEANIVDGDHSLGEKGILPLPENIKDWNGSWAPAWDRPMSAQTNLLHYGLYMSNIKNKVMGRRDRIRLYPDLFRLSWIKGNLVREARLVAGIIHGYFYGPNFDNRAVPFDRLMAGYKVDQPLVEMMAGTTYKSDPSAALPGRQANIEQAIGWLAVQQPEQSGSEMSALYPAAIERLRSTRRQHDGKEQLQVSRSIRHGTDWWGVVRVSGNDADGQLLVRVGADGVADVVAADNTVFPLPGSVAGAVPTAVVAELDVDRARRAGSMTMAAAEPPWVTNARASAPAYNGGSVDAIVRHWARAATSNLRTHDAPGTEEGSLACAWAVNRIVRLALGKMIGPPEGETQTAEMIKELRRRHALQTVLNPGLVVISPSVILPSGRKVTGHVGVLGGDMGQPVNDDTKIISNSSENAIVMDHRTVASWRRYYVDRLGLEMLFFALNPVVFDLVTKIMTLSQPATLWDGPGASGVVRNLPHDPRIRLRVITEQLPWAQVQLLTPGGSVAATGWIEARVLAELPTA